MHFCFPNFPIFQCSGDGLLCSAQLPLQILLATLQALRVQCCEISWGVPNSALSTESTGWCKGNLTGNRSKIAQRKRGSWSFFLYPDSVSIVPVLAFKEAQQGFSNLKPGFCWLLMGSPKWVESHFNHKTSMLCCRGNLHSPPVEGTGNPMEIHHPWILFRLDPSPMGKNSMTTLRLPWYPLLGLEEILPTASNGSGQGSWSCRKMCYFQNHLGEKKRQKEGERCLFQMAIWGIFIIFKYPLVNVDIAMENHHA